MRAFLALAFCTLAPTLHAQPLSPYAPVQPDRTPLAEAQEVPFAFLLGLDGATPLFVNPARAARAKHRFVYGTVDPEQGNGPVSLSALVGSRDNRWLITAENLALTSDRENTSTFSDRVTQPNFFRTEERSERRTSTALDNGTRGRVLLVGRTDFGGYAFGLFGGYRQFGTETDRQSERSVREERDAIPSTSLNESTVTSRLEDRLEVFGVGAEVALAGRTWDVAASVSYQGGSDWDVFVESSDQTNRLTDESGSGFERVTTQERERENRIEASPQGVGFDALGTLRVGDHRDDYLFASAAGVFESGTGTYSQDFFLRRVERITQNGVTTEDRFLDEFDDGGDSDLSTRVLDFTLGYVYAHKGRRARVLAGLLPTASLNRVEAIDTGSVEFEPQADLLTFDRTALGVELPLHVHVPLKRSLALFGGGVYAYDYLRTEQTVEPLSPPSDLPEDFEQERMLSVTNTTFQSRNRLYGGATLALRSGLTAQAAFRGDLANFERWTVSLGYRF